MQPAPPLPNGYHLIGADRTSLPSGPAGTVLYGASASGWNGVYLAEVARRAPSGQAAQATSGTLACTFFGVLLGAPLFGLVVSSPGGYTLAFAMQAFFALSIGGLLFINRAKFSDTPPDSA